MSGLVAHLILTQQLGENSTTPRDPVRVLDRVEDATAIAANGTTYDLGEITYCCLHADDNRQVPVAKYGTVLISLPAWLSPEEWLRDTTKWKWTWGCGVDPFWPEQWQRKLARMGTAKRLACAKLLSTKKFRSNFRRSLRNQLEAWLAEEEPRFDSPFSHKQWGCLVNTFVAREARGIDSSLYRRKGCADATLFNA